MWIWTTVVLAVWATGLHAPPTEDSRITNPSGGPAAGVMYHVLVETVAATANWSGQLWVDMKLRGTAKGWGNMSSLVLVAGSFSPKSPLLVEYDSKKGYLGPIERVYLGLPSSHLPGGWQPGQVIVVHNSTDGGTLHYRTVFPPPGGQMLSPGQSVTLTPGRTNMAPLVPCVSTGVVVLAVVCALLALILPHWVGYLAFLHQMRAAAVVLVGPLDRGHSLPRRSRLTPTMDDMRVLLTTCKGLGVIGDERSSTSSEIYSAASPHKATATVVPVTQPQTPPPVPARAPLPATRAKDAPAPFEPDTAMEYEDAGAGGDSDDEPAAEPPPVVRKKLSVVMEYENASDDEGEPKQLSAVMEYENASDDEDEPKPTPPSKPPTRPMTSPLFFHPPPAKKARQSSDLSDHKESKKKKKKHHKTGESEKSGKKKKKKRRRKSDYNESDDERRRRKKERKKQRHASND